jgi:hypothetical protein
MGGGSVKFNVISLITISFFFAANVNAAEQKNYKHLGTAEQQLRAIQWNKTHSSRTHAAWNVQRPFSEIEQTGYVATNSADAFDSEMDGLRTAIAQNLPQGVTLILYVTDPSQVDDLKQRYGQYLNASQLKFVTVPDTGDDLWARDSLPFPVYLNSNHASTAPSFGLVASIYPQNFDPNEAFETAFALPSVNTNVQFRGGNLLFDLKGNCFAENANEIAAMQDPQGFLKQYFGCTTATILDYTSGLGDIDERIKFLTGNTVLTDNASYATTLKGKGYDVHMIPETGVDRETYMNTLYVNGTIFVPQMGLSSDQAALDAYKALGMKPVGVLTKTIADEGDGNIHCLTMNYPQGSFTPSAKHADFVEFAK